MRRAPRSFLRFEARSSAVSDANINIDYVYGGASEGSPTATLVLGVENAQRAAAAAGV